MSILHNEVGYRTETYAGSGVRDVSQVFSFEILELGNVDILDTLLDETLFIQDENLRRDMRWASEYLMENGAPHWDGDNEEYPDDTEDDKKLRALIPKIIDEVRKYSGFDIKYALWLADYDEVMRNDENGGYGVYITDPATDIQKYHTSPVILSYLGTMGILYGYVDEPQPIED